ncbi:hypothetical protein D1872_265570 [compost metagenome]
MLHWIEDIAISLDVSSLIICQCSQHIAFGQHNCCWNGRFVLLLIRNEITEQGQYHISRFIVLGDELPTLITQIELDSLADRTNL